MEKICELPQAELGPFLTILGGASSLFPDASGTLSQDQFIERLQCSGYQGDALQDFLNIDTDYDGKISIDDINRYLKATPPRNPISLVATVCDGGQLPPASPRSTTAPDGAGLASTFHIVRQQLDVMKAELRRVLTEQHVQHNKMLELMERQVATAVQLEIKEAMKKYAKSADIGSSNDGRPNGLANLDLDFLQELPTRTAQVEERLSLVEEQCSAILLGLTKAAQAEKVEDQCRAILQGFSDVADYATDGVVGSGSNSRSIGGPVQQASQNPDMSQSPIFQRTLVSTGSAGTSGQIAGVIAGAATSSPRWEGTSPTVADSAGNPMSASPKVAEASGADKRTVDALLYSPRQVSSARQSLTSPNINQAERGLAKPLLCRTAAVKRSSPVAQVSLRQQAGFHTGAVKAGRPLGGSMQVPPHAVREGSLGGVAKATSVQVPVHIQREGSARVPPQGPVRQSSAKTSLKAAPSSTRDSIPMTPKSVARNSGSVTIPNGIVRMVSAPDTHYLEDSSSVVRMLSTPRETVILETREIIQTNQVFSPRQTLVSVSADYAQ